MISRLSTNCPKSTSDASNFCFALHNRFRGPAGSAVKVAPVLRAEGYLDSTPGLPYGEDQEGEAPRPHPPGQ